MHRAHENSRCTVLEGTVDNQRRVEYALLSIQELAVEAARRAISGTIGVEIPVKNGTLGKVKRLKIVFQSD